MERNMRRIVWVFGLLALLSLTACAGEDGKAGTPGEAGQPGATGSDGTQGDDGTPGDDGAPGSDGAAASATDVNDAVRTVLNEQLTGAVQDAVVDELGARKTGCDAIEMDPADYDGVFQVGKHLQPGEETEVCALYKTGPKEIWLNHSDLVMAEGSHHGLIWLTTLEEQPEVDNLGEPVELGKIVECDGTVVRFDPAARPISGSQGAGNAIAKGIMPDDVAIKVPANSYVVADLHMLNVRDVPIDACMKVGFQGIPKKDVNEEAGTYFMYNPFITLPAEKKAQARLACPISKDTNLKSAVSHMHRFGVGYEATLLDGSPFESGTKKKRTLFEGSEWEAPVDEIFGKPLALEAGDWVDFTCEYDNLTDDTITEGTETVDEMCMFIGVMWPYDRSISECARDGEGINGGAGNRGFNIGNGDMEGADFLSCVWENSAGFEHVGAGRSDLSDAEHDDNYAVQSCFTEACEAIGEFTRPFTNCLGDNVGGCQLDCTDAQTQYQTLCAVTPVANGGCAEKYGTNGSNGTCATGTDTTSAAVATCMEDIRQAAISEVCMTLPNAAQGCAEDCAADPTAVGCTTCLGTIDFMPGNTKCLNLHTLGCMQEEVPPLAEACATDCFTGCITEKVTNCVVTCINEDRCLPEVTGLMTTACD